MMSNILSFDVGTPYAGQLFCLQKLETKVVIFILFYRIFVKRFLPFSANRVSVVVNNDYFTNYSQN